MKFQPVIHHIEYMPSGEQSAMSADKFAKQRSTWGTKYKFNSKELDQETGLYYYGARYYNPTLSIWASVDPLSDKTPNVSPYAYCINNPVRIIDPDGRDWFENELTGAVYYNNKLRKNDAGTGAMTGDGWKHMGANGMFTNGEKYSTNDDYWLVVNNNGKMSFDNKSNSVTLELMLDGGGKAESFMSNLGYDKKPKLADVNVTETTQSNPEPHGINFMTTSTEFIDKVHTWTYSKKEAVGDFNIIGNYKGTQRHISVLTMSSTERRYERRYYDYGKKPGLISGSTFNSLLKIGSDFFQTWYDSKKR